MNKKTKYLIAKITLSIVLIISVYMAFQVVLANILVRNAIKQTEQLQQEYDTYQEKTMIDYYKTINDIRFGVNR